MSDKIFSISDNPTIHNVMTEEQKRALELLAQKDKQDEDQTNITVELDGSNKVKFPGFPYLFEALGEKIIVSIDIFKSGYECRECKGAKVHKTMCSCEAEGHPGMRYSPEEIQIVRESIGDGIADSRKDQVCPTCTGDYESLRSETTCAACKGYGALLVLPSESKNRPTTGVVVSMGEATLPEIRLKLGKVPLNYKIGDRILFGAYSGSMIPTQAGIAFKTMDCDAAIIRIDGAEDLAQFDFVLQDENA